MKPPPFGAHVIALPGTRCQEGTEVGNRAGVVVDMPCRSDHTRDVWRFVRFHTARAPQFAWVASERLRITKAPPPWRRP